MFGRRCAATSRYARLMEEAGMVVCSYELVRGEKIVSTGRFTLPAVPAVGERILLGGRRLEVVGVMPGTEPRLRLRG